MLKKLKFKKIISSFLATMMLFQLEGITVFADEVKQEVIQETIGENNSQQGQSKNEKYIQTRINSIELESKEIDYNIGGKIYINVDNPELIERIIVGYNNTNAYNIVLNYNEDTGNFEGNIRTDYEYSESNNEFVFECLTIVKSDIMEYVGRDDLKSKFGFEEDIADYRVIKKTSDIQSIILSSNEVNYPNGYTNIYVTTSYPELVNTMKINYNNNGYSSHAIYLYYNYSTNRFEGSIYGCNYNPGEKYNFNSIDISTFDSYYYKTVYRNELESIYGINPETLDYSIVKENIGIKSITVENKKIYPNIYKADSVKVKMEMENPQNVNYITVVYGSKYNNYSNFEVSLYKNWETGIFEGATSPWSYTLGENEVKEIRIGTYYGTNVLTREELKLYENIDLESLTVDINPYIPNDIFININEAEKGDTVIVSADLSNYPFEVENARINYNFRPISGGSWSSELQLEMIYNQGTGLYEGKYQVGALTEGGLKEVYSLEIIEKDGSITTVYNDGYEMNLNWAQFEVKNNVDKFIYPIKVQAEINKAELSDRVKISVSGLSITNGNVTAKYINLNTDSEKYVYFHYNKKTKNWEGYFNVDTYDSDGIWALDNISISESINDSWISIEIYNKELHKDKDYVKNFGKADIEVNGTLNDTIAPELISVNVDKKQVQVGDTVVVTIDAKDDLSGVKSVYLSYNNGSTNISTSDIKLNPITGKYEAYIKINGIDLNGTYRLSNITIYDNANNSLNVTNYNMFSKHIDIYEDLSDANFEVINSLNSKSEIITSLSISEKEVQVNEEIELSIEVADRTGLEYITVSYLKDNSYANYKEVKLTYNEKDNKYNGVLKIDSLTELGQWQINNIYFINSNNRCIGDISKYDYDIEYILNQGNFEVIFRNGEGLKLDSLNIDKNKVTVGNKVTLQAKASDIDGEIRNITVEYISPEGKTLNIKLKEVSNGFIGEFEVSKYTSAGEWKINSVLLEDNERNRTLIYNTEVNPDKEGMNLSKANIEVYGTSTDDKAPVLLDVEVDKERVNYGDTVKVSIVAKDDVSGIKSVKAGFSCTGSGELGYLVEFDYNEDTKMYEYIIDTTKPHAYESSWINSLDGWIISELYMEDNAGNIFTTTYWNNEILKGAYFYIDATGKWFISELTDKSQAVEGITEVNANIEVTIGNEVYDGKADTFGKFKISIPTQEGNTVVKVKVMNSLGVVIQEVERIVKDIDAPESPIVTTVVNNKTTILEGTTEANAEIIIEKEVKVFGGVKIEEVTRTIADGNGNFKVTIPMQDVNTSLGIKAIDKFGNVSEYTNIIVKNINREDVNYDGVIDIIDIALIGRRYNSMIGDKEWDSDLDVNEDDIVDIFDIIMVSKKME